MMASALAGWKSFGNVRFQTSSVSAASFRSPVTRS